MSTPKQEINVNTFAGRKRAEAYFKDLPAKKERIAELVYKMSQLSEQASFYMTDSTDYFNFGPDGSDLSWAELIDETQEKILKITLDEL